ncbi:hypothetical protein LTR37_015263, partial [Vermiconidia calcicola]
MVAGAAILENALSENPSSVLTKRDEFSCSGSTNCWGDPNTRRDCDDAMNSLDLGKMYTAGT